MIAPIPIRPAGPFLLSQNSGIYSPPHRSTIVRRTEHDDLNAGLSGKARYALLRVSIVVGLLALVSMHSQLPVQVTGFFAAGAIMCAAFAFFAHLVNVEASATTADTLFKVREQV